ncbi:MAG: beta-ketoacyl-ACP synthase III [Chitinophagales bacterium]|nr:beta-ketoacyl-ACP synthase III [Chitinophagales bacterium]
MPLKDVFITRSAVFFPNEPVSNNEMESYLGLINGKPSRAKAIVLRNNGIKRRYYALQKGGVPTHTNAQLTSLAVRNLFEKNADELKEIKLLCCGTSSPDQLMPSHGVMVHGWLPETGAVEVFTPSGNCCAGMQALKYAYMAIRTGEVSKAVTTGSERLSRALYAESFEEEAKRLAELEENPILAFEKEFLRWMLSDGAGAFLVSDKKNEEGLSLRIDWIESASYAHLAEPCMYMAADKTPDGKLKSYMDFTPHEIMEQSVLSMKQDVRLLDKYIVALGYETLKSICDKKNFSVAEIDYFLPHLSSEFFRKKIAETLNQNGMGIPPEKWFTNLTEVGNVGAGSTYLMIDELLRGNRLQKGQKMLLMIPESARFAYVYALLTVC